MKAVRDHGPCCLALSLALAVGTACATARPPRPGPDVAPPPESAPPQAEAVPVVREIEIIGATLFPREALLRYLRLRPGARLRRPVAEVAQDLEDRYHVQGYIGADVQAAYAAETALLTVTVDEGRLHEVVVLGLEGAAAERAHQELALDKGAIVREKDLRAALHRLEDRAGGAVSAAAHPPYSVERVDGGVRATFRVVRHRTRLRPWVHDPDMAPLGNRVEGLTLPASVLFKVFDPAGFNHAEIYARAAYGFTSKDVRYAGGARRPFGKEGLFTLGAEVHDLTDTDDVFRRGGLLDPRGSQIAFSITEDYFRRRGYEAYGFFRPSPRVHVGATFRSDRHSSLPVLTDDYVALFFKRTPRLNPAVDEGRLRSVLLTARLAGHDALFPTRAEESESFLVRSPYGQRYQRAQRFRADTTLEIASAGTLGGDFSFRRLIAQARGTRDLGPRQTLHARMLVGLTGGTPPLQRRFALGGANTLRGYPVKAFPGENMLLGTAEWTFQPRSRYPRLALFYDGGSVWTSGQTGSGWRDDVGAGFEWPGGGLPFLRLDVGVPLQKVDGDRSARFHALIRLPF